MPTPERCPVCGGPWPDRDHEAHDRLADALHELYGPDFTAPADEEGDTPS